MFRKRQGPKGTKRYSTTESDEDDEYGRDEVKNRLVELHEIQNLRKRSKPTFETNSTELKNKSLTNKISKSEASSSSSDKFLVQKDNGLENYNEVKHEKIMEKYIEDRLGLTKEVKVDELQSTVYADNQIYKMPDKLKNILAGISDNHKPDDSIGILGVGSGLAEIELPMSYKLSNIEATERARRSILESQCRSKSLDESTLTSFGSFRFQKALGVQTFDLGDRPSLHSDIAVVPADTAASLDARSRPSGRQVRSDDITLKKFVKHQNGRRR